MPRNAFVLRITPGGQDHVAEALQANELIIGWSCAAGLVDPGLSWDRFRQTIKDECYSEDSNFEITSKRRKGFPSETQVRRGVRIVHGNKELFEKLGRNDLCPCGSGRSF